MTIQFRKATLEDSHSLYELFMVDDIMRYMSFEFSSEEQFRKVLEEKLASSDVYVLEDPETNEIVATRRICFGSGPHEHVAELASMAVHKNHRGKGYGKQLFNEFIKLIKEQYPNIKIIEITQESDNKPAFELSQKQGFVDQYTMPDWLIRRTGDYSDKWYVGERFLAYFLDDEFNKMEINESKATNPNASDILSQIELASPVEFPKTNDPAVIEFEEIGCDRCNHIVLINAITYEQNCDLQSLTSFLRKAILEKSKQYKKVEINLADIPENNLVIHALEKIGFIYRGQKHKGFKASDTNFLNELAFDISFFNIEDTKKCLDCSSIENYHIEKLKSILTDLQNELEQAKKINGYDPLSVLLIENIAYQYVRLFALHPHEALQMKPILESRIEQLPNGPLKDLFNKLKEVCLQPLIGSQKSSDEANQNIPQNLFNKKP